MEKEFIFMTKNLQLITKEIGKKIKEMERVFFTLLMEIMKVFGTKV
jgi:hypothetical protein